jgi:uncharacterized protein
VNLRSLTGFLNLTETIHDSDFRALRDLVRAARADFAHAGFPLQTARVATQSLDNIAPRDLAQWARDIETACKANGVDYAALGALTGKNPLIVALPAAIGATENVFAAMHIASRKDGINLHSISAAARVIRALADSTSGGFGNLRFAALANVPAHSPFFPAAYHDGGAPSFALATEAAPLAIEAFSQTDSLDQARQKLVSAIESASEALTSIANDLAARFEFRFVGIDFSLAPHPDESRSIGAAIERLIGAEFGEHGTLFAAAFITDCINRAQFPRTGFSGLMLPVLEDAVLGARSANYSLDSLLLYSTVCGTGLDTVPLPGDTSPDALAAILLDLATLAVKLNKPLTARLMPIPGLRAGDETHFEFEYFTQASVFAPNASTLRIFSATETVDFMAKNEK